MDKKTQTTSGMIKKQCTPSSIFNVLNVAVKVGFFECGQAIIIAVGPHMHPDFKIGYNTQAMQSEGFVIFTARCFIASPTK